MSAIPWYILNESAVSFAPNPMSWSLKFDETIAFIKGKALMAIFATVVAIMDDLQRQGLQK